MQEATKSPMRAAVIIALAFTLCALSACSSPSQPPAAPTTPSVSSAPISLYNNGWDDGDRRAVYHLSAGGEVLSLALLQSLERAKLPTEGNDGQLVPFLQNLERYGFIPDAVSSENPFGLPVGWTVARSLLDTTALAGFNCTACHVGEVRIDGKSLRIDGGPNMLRINDLFKDMTTELMATTGDVPRMARLTASLIRNRDANEAKLPPSSSGTAAQRVQQKMDALPLVKASLDYLRSMKTVGEMGAVENGAVENGYGRVDAFGVARNLLFGSDTRNLRPQNAPVSFPYMWGLKTTAWLQWGANINSVMERNIGQTLGVGARFDSSFATTSRLDNLNTIEKRVYKLTAPEWREDLLGAIDRAKADRGRPLYEKLCSNCHDRPFAVSPTGLVTYQLFRLSEVGTSPAVATNFDRTVFTANGERRLADAAFEAIEAIKQQYYKTNNISPEMQADWEGRDMRPLPEWKPSFRSTLAEADRYPDTKGGRVYPAKPLAGIWATAPYLNNGSVANMWDLLTRPQDRPKTFSVGSREYDTRSLGYRSTPGAAAAGPLFVYDTTKPGNSNAGHVYGTQLGDEDKWALIEYLKVLKPGEFKKEPLQAR
jgi:hypothetical protein